jgi:hypothetical protein
MHILECHLFEVFEGLALEEIYHPALLDLFKSWKDGVKWLTNWSYLNACHVEEEEPRRGWRCRPVIAAALLPPPNPAKKWKKVKLKTEDLLTPANRGFLHEKEINL